MMHEFTYLIGLAIVGLVLFTIGMVAAKRDRREREDRERRA
jgi:hypothetical protein